MEQIKLFRLKFENFSGLHCLCHEHPSKQGKTGIVESLLNFSLEQIFLKRTFLIPSRRVTCQVPCGSCGIIVSIVSGLLTRTALVTSLQGFNIFIL